MQDSCSCAHINLLTNGLQCPSSVPTTPQPSFAFHPISVHFCLPEPTRIYASIGHDSRRFDSCKSVLETSVQMYCMMLIERVYRYLDCLKSLQRACRRKSYIRPYTSGRSHDLEAAILTVSFCFEQDRCD
jgi:hypothetical protein